MKWNRLLVVFLVVFRFSFAQAQQAPPNPQPDARYKLDILIVVGPSGRRYLGDLRMLPS